MLSITEARDVLRRLAAAAGSTSREAFQHGSDFLLGCDGPTWLLLDDQARRYRMGGYESPPLNDPRLGKRPWIPDGTERFWPTPAEALRESADFRPAMASMHTDGRIRQAATAFLSGAPGTLRTLALTLRTLDHVPAVRTDAQLGLDVQLAFADDDRAVRALEILVAAAGRRHTAAALARVSSVLLQDEARLRRLQNGSDGAVRRWLYGVAFDRGLLTGPELVRVISTDHDQRLRARCIHWLERVATSADLVRLLGGRFADGRALAVRLLPRSDLSDAELLPFLADPSSRVRELARWRARRRGIDSAAWYREQLDSASLTSAAACLHGLAQTGNDSDVPVFERFLTHPAPRTRAVATLALGSARMAPSPGSVHPVTTPPPMLRSALFFARYCLTQARGCARRRHGRWPGGGAPASDADEALRSDQAWSRKAGLRLVRSGGGWGRLLADVRATTDPDPEIARLGRLSLLDWLSSPNPNTWNQLAAADRSTLDELLPRVDLTDDQRRRLQFYLG